ncbi:RagB/SusD family nutrient uptake outer membrane protein [Pedobacter fastidiosus]|uniref:RagB/SusD family nutrient uptake outer membrane protein n=1 Tax=Pedobacter fastidiosus TaxID=2765361 RepID=A0ABR7KUG2_9SPHI|nr:RagB/SusD family nutrient uptake outer membrane protein [Pedobacter fastidiosus]MBC6111746.1 RagB/SusD family nutrient uptake outer membrane protein [Pedobacter fastidiosus]
MNNKFIKSALMVIAVGALSITTSCKKYLDVESPSSSSPEVVFESTTYTNSAIVGVYNRLCGDNGYGSRISTLFGLSADDFKTSGSYSSSDRRGISMYGASSDNTDLTNPFLQLYQGVERANICIKYIPASKLYSNGSAADQILMKRYYGEALALRAQFLYELIRNWGDVPASFVPAADAETLYGPNVDHNKTYDQILADLKLAEDLVPWRSSIAEYGSFRFTKGAIKGLRARIALARGGYALKVNQMVRSSDYLTFYKIAFDECLDIMNHPADHKLNPVYENVFKSLHGTRADDAHELMFEVAAFGSNASTDSKLGYYNGIRFNAASTFGTGGGGMNAVPTYFYEFDVTKDSRRDVTIGVFEITATSKKIINTLFNMTDGKFRKSWTAFNGSSASQNFAVNWPILRYADVLLMYAEADNEINGSPSATAISALQEVQKRAYVGFETQIPVTPTDKAGFFTAIVKERLLEFGGEGIRKYDLIRWNLLGSKFDETRTKLRALIAGTGAYAGVPDYIYAKEGTYLLGTSVNEVATLDLYGGTPNNVFVSPGLGSSSAPTGYTTKNWRKAVTEENAITSTSTGLAFYFEANKKELFPYPKTALIENPSITQNFGY